MDTFKAFHPTLNQYGLIHIICSGYILNIRGGCGGPGPRGYLAISLLYCHSLLLLTYYLLIESLDIDSNGLPLLQSNYGAHLLCRHVTGKVGEERIREKAGY